MKLLSMASAGILFALVGCNQQQEVDESKAGTLSLNLIGTDRAGEQYRLRNATFDLYGYPDYFEVTVPPPTGGAGPSAGTGGVTEAGTPAMAGSGTTIPVTGGAAGGIGVGGSVTGGSPNFYSETFSSDEDPDAAVITRRLLPGYYQVTLANSDFYLEHLTPSGPERVEKVVLLSGRTVWASVWNGGVSYVSYQFGVGGDAIDFRSGELQIGIGIEHPGENTGGFAGFGGVAGMPATGGIFGRGGAGPL